MLTKDEAVAKTVTGDEVRTACLAKKLKLIRCRQCSICQAWLSFHVLEEDLFFDSSCDCTSSNGWQGRTWDDGARLINMQTNPEVKVQFMKDFGFDVEE